MMRRISVFCFLLSALSPQASALRPPSVVLSPAATHDLRHSIYTNVVAHTNGRTTQFQKRIVHPPGWPTNSAPIIEWQTNALLYGWKGFNGMSMCNEFEGSHGQMRVTMVTRRHGYTRGHGTGEPPRSVRTNRAGMKYWFLTTNNVVVESVIAADFMRSPWNGSPPYPRETNDWMLLLFTQDLPENIPVLPVITQEDFNAYYPGSPSNILFCVEQGGHCGAQSNPGLRTPFPEFAVNAWKGGDSGSPNFLPMPDGSLVLAGGRGTSFASPVMQADIDALTRWAGLKTNDYQLRWVSLTNYARH